MVVSYIDSNCEPRIMCLICTQDITNYKTEVNTFNTHINCDVVPDNCSVLFVKIGMYRTHAGDGRLLGGQYFGLAHIFKNLYNVHTVPCISTVLNPFDISKNVLLSDLLEKDWRHLIGPTILTSLADLYISYYKKAPAFIGEEATWRSMNHVTYGLSRLPDNQLNDFCIELDSLMKVMGDDGNFYKTLEPFMRCSIGEQYALDTRERF